MRMLALLLIFSGATFAEEAAKALEELQNQYAKLEGYEVRYEATTQTGNTAVIEVGAHFQSGWAFLTTEIKGTEGEVLQKNQQWATDQGLFVLQEGDTTQVFEGFANLGKRFSDLQKLFNPEKEVPLIKIAPSSYLTKTGSSTSMGYTSTPPPWLREPERVIASDDKEIQLDWGKHGVIHVARDSGLITKQEISLDDGKRILKLVEFKKNIKAESIAKRFKLKIEGAPRKKAADSEMSREIIRKVFQDLINQVSTIENGAQKTEPLLEKLEARFVTYLEGEPLDRSGAFEPEKLIKLIEDFVTLVQEKAEAKGQKVAAPAILNHPKLSRGFEEKSAEVFLKAASPKVSQRVLIDLLGGELQARGREGNNTRRLVSNFLEKCYYQIKIRRAVQAYLKAL